MTYTLTQLRKIAKDKHIKNYSKLSKDELIKLISCEKLTLHPKDIQSISGVNWLQHLELDGVHFYLFGAQSHADCEGVDIVDLVESITEHNPEIMYNFLYQPMIYFKEHKKVKVDDVLDHIHRTFKDKNYNNLIVSMFDFNKNFDNVDMNCLYRKQDLNMIHEIILNYTHLLENPGLKELYHRYNLIYDLITENILCWLSALDHDNGPANFSDMERIMYEAYVRGESWDILDFFNRYI